MDVLVQDPVLYWLIWTIATVFGVIIGWSLRANYREKAILDAYERSEQERNSIAHLYNQLRVQHDQKSVEIKRLSLESSHLREQIAQVELEQAGRDGNRLAQQARLEKAQADAAHAHEKVLLLEENIRHLRDRDERFALEVTRLHEELNGWKKLHRDFNNLLRQVQTLETQSAQLENERNHLRLQLDAARLEINNLQNSMLHTADGDSDQDEPTSQVDDVAK